MNKRSKIAALTVFTKNPEYQDPKWLPHPAQMIKELRWWQNEAFAKLKDSNFALIVAFCGSGKSILQVAMAVYDVIKSDWMQKQLVVVPQSHIHQGFVSSGGVEYISIKVEGILYEWKVNHNFCDDKSQAVLAGLKKWLLTDPRTLANGYYGANIISGLNVVASHQALGLVFKTMTKVEKKQAVKNLTLRVDEGHHVDGLFDDDEESLTDDQKLAVAEERTNLGDICNLILNAKKTTSKIHMTTATPYRGDRKMIFSPAVMKKFEKYFLDWIEHFKTLGIADFSLEYEEYKGDPIKQCVNRIKREPSQKHMIVIPPTGQKWRMNGQKEFEALMKSIYKVVPKDRVLDLVTPSTQDKNKAILLAEPKTGADGPSNYDVVVTCMLGREGTDWCPCSRMHNLSCENSVTLAIQTMGRPFRRFEGKTTVRIYYYVPFFAKPKKGMTKRDLLADRTNALLVCIQMDEMCHPILIPTMRPIVVGGASESGSGRPSLMDVFGADYQRIKQDFFEDIECLADKSAEEIDKIIDAVILNEGVKEDVDGVRGGLRILAMRVLAPPQFKADIMGIDVSFVRKAGFDKLVEKYGLRKQSIFFGGYDAKDWAILRPIFKERWNWDEMFKECVEAGDFK
jgi:hypothetical protein